MRLYTPFYGKNFSNIISSIIIKILDSIDEKHNTNIKVSNFNNFIIVNGYTSINQPVNISHKVREYLDINMNIEKSMNFIDLIEYGTDNKCINHHIEYHSIDNNTNNQLLKKLHDCTYLNPQGYIEIEDEGLYTNNEKLTDFLYGDSPLNKHLTCDFLPHTSDCLFGNSLNEKKVLEWYIRLISYNIIETSICSEIKIDLFFNSETINNDSVKLHVKCIKSIIDSEWIKSKILDIFNFNINQIIDTYNLKNVNFTDDVINFNKSWEVRDKIGDFILL